MPVCLHCGELAPDGALFCTKCGYTLPQGEASPAVVPPPPGPPGVAGARPGSPAPPPLYVPVAAPGSYAAPAPPPVPGATGPMAPPPNGKFCVRCRTLIARSAVYCPVCQQPQPP
ncbi:MAG TPA: zinc-ribbon domain-containing protein [Thermoplasmata archaeon]|nr:zinc-ribbon domain-containing protein [Thermoplasmata archaeon]